jgi:proteic killer suppression protein
VIKSFKGKLAKRVWERNPSKQLLAIWEIAYDGLSLLHSITDLRQLERVPGLRLHKLKGDRQKQRAFWVGKSKYRICFEWKDGNAYNVELIDYHD